MAYIEVPDGLPGIRGLVAFRPETAEPLGALADVLLHQPGPLPRADRELIGAYVSRLNGCAYCENSHAAIAACHLRDDALVGAAIADPERAPVSSTLRALLALAGRVQRGGREVRMEDVERARREGASDAEIHDTVLIAALFCLFNRDVDGLGTWTPVEGRGYEERAAFVAEHGYSAVLRQTRPAEDPAAR